MLTSCLLPLTCSFEKNFSCCSNTTWQTVMSQCCDITVLLVCITYLYIEFFTCLFRPGSGDTSWKTATLPDAVPTATRSSKQLSNFTAVIASLLPWKHTHMDTGYHIFEFLFYLGYIYKLNVDALSSLAAFWQHRHFMPSLTFTNFLIMCPYHKLYYMSTIHVYLDCVNCTVLFCLLLFQ